MSVTLSTADKNDLFRDLAKGDTETREYALRVLKRHADSGEVVQFLRKLKLNDWQGKIYACRLFIKINDDLAVQKLKDLLLDFNHRVRREAEKSLKKLGIDQPFTDDEVVELVSFLGHPSWWVKTKAIKSLEALGEPRAIEPISRLLLDEDETVRDAAKQAVESLGRINK